MTPLPQQPAYGDTARIEQLASGLKRTNGTSGPLVERTPAGRPVGSTTTASSPQAPASPVTGVHKELYDSVARAEWVRQFWAQMAQRFPFPEVQYYQANADRMADEVAKGVYDSTANFEF